MRTQQTLAWFRLGLIACAFLFFLSLGLTPSARGAEKAAGVAAKAGPVAKAKAAFAALDVTEQEVYEKNKSLEMARSATREIARSSRETVERALKEVLISRELLGYATGADRTMARKRADARLVTLRSATHRMMKDHEVANFATDLLIPSEYDLKKAMATTRAAKVKVLELEAKAAERVAKRKPSQENADKLKAARQALADGKAIGAWEVQQWGVVQINTGWEIWEMNSGAAQIAQQVVAVETDPEARKKFADFIPWAKKKEAVGTRLSKHVAKVMRQEDAEVYPLRAAAMGGLKPLKPAAFDDAKARHLLVRAGFGGTPQEIAKLQAMGLYAAVDYLVDYEGRASGVAPFEAVRYPLNDPYLAKVEPALLRNISTRWARKQYTNQMEELRKWWLTSMVETKRPLQEKMTLFWHGHFATQYSVVANSFAIFNQNRMFRERATDNFGGLLYEIVHDPVMIRFLDNNSNVKGHANENLAREIMELFAMGAYQGYDEDDVKEAARALTGYMFNQQNSQFRYTDGKHDKTSKTIFGKKGNFTGDDLVRLILEQPATSRFVAQRLYQYFGHIEPNYDTVDQLAAVLKVNHYEVKPMLKNMFLSEAFYSPEVMGSQIKSPVDLAVGTLRSMGVKELGDAGPMVLAIREMGQDLFEPPDVKGWRAGRSWVNSTRLFTRYNEVAAMLRDVNGEGVDAIGLARASGAKNVEQVVDAFALACLGKKLGRAPREALIDFVGALPVADQWERNRVEVNDRLQRLLVLMTSNPDYQLH